MKPAQKVGYRIMLQVNGIDDWLDVIAVVCYDFLVVIRQTLITPTSSCSGTMKI